MELILLALATWRLTALFHCDYGPWDIFFTIRTKVGVYYLGDDGRPITGLGKLFQCFWCVSVWAALAIAGFYLQRVDLDLLFYTLALSAGAIMINEVWRWLERM